MNQLSSSLSRKIAFIFVLLPSDNLKKKKMLQKF